MDLQLNPLQREIWMVLRHCPGWEGPPSPWPMLRMTTLAIVMFTRPWLGIDFAIRVWQREEANKHLLVPSTPFHPEIDGGAL